MLRVNLICNEGRTLKYKTKTFVSYFRFFFFYWLQSKEDIPLESLPASKDVSNTTKVYF